MVDGAYYQGESELIDYARWSAEEQQFVFMRQKFAPPMVKQTIKHIEDFDGKIAFVPKLRVDVSAVPIEKRIR